MKHWMFLLLLLAPLSHAGQPVVSGYEFLSDETKEIQDDDFLNPGMATVELGRELFNAPADDGPACAECHGVDGEKLDVKKISAYPLYDAPHASVLTLQDRIHICWEDKLERFPISYDEPDAVALETFVRHLARGEPVRTEVNEDSREFYELGKKLYYTRFGQINMSCQHCHIQHQGQMLRGQQLTHGQSNGFPVYRFVSDRITSLHRRLNECFVQMRAESFEAGSEEYKALEYYMSVMGKGLKIETPGVRF
ncbi:MAG: sulfur oxidation c-type cytochrome SoxA [Chromatiales bacterium]|jgi:sulfur-oxidizing protein SoxA